ncbi:MAG: hypothetical protein U1F41_07405 [Burkholderiales bacterium]
MAPHVLVAAWTAFLAVSLWQHALASVQPPWGDGVGYLWKAASFWNAVQQGTLFNPLDLFPTVRPPGTILMSYPFGMTADFRGYHFRSVFLPLLCTVLAVYVAGGTENAKRHPWQVAGYALLLSSLPMFYWLDRNDARSFNNGWGMVDGFQAGIAALAGAAIVRSIAKRSLGWLALAAFLASFTFFVKQSGMMLMGLLGLAWLIVLGFERRLAPQDAPPVPRYLVGGMLVFAAIYGTVVALALSSAYLSRSNFNWAMNALDLYRGIAPEVSIRFFHRASGELAAVWMLAVAALFAARFGDLLHEDRLSAARALGLATGALVIWLLGVWYWIFAQAGGNQIRYFYPFMLMGAICAVPAVLSAWPQSRRWIRGALLVACIASAANIGLMLSAGDSPPHRWQDLTGVNVSVGHDREEVANAHALLAQVRASGKDAQVYFTPIGGTPQTYVFVGIHEKIVHPGLPGFKAVSPMDWDRGFVVRTAEIADSDYIVTRKLENRPAESRFAAKAFPTFEAEMGAFDGWLSTLDARAGVETFWDGRVLRVLRVTDRGKLSAAIAGFVAQHEWRPEFAAANRPAPAAWTDAQGAAADLRSPATGPVTFEDAYVVHAIASRAVDGGVTVDVWWEEIRHDPANDRRYLFLHLIDAKGAIVQGTHIPLFPYEPPSADRRWRYATTTFHNVLPNPSIRALAFGIYEPERKDGGLMSSNSDGRTDWGGKRNIVAIAPDEPSAKPRAN